MTHLPAEVLLLVSALLPQRDQVECMTVCRHWHNTIQPHSLCRDIYIYSQEQLDKLVDKAKRDPLFGKKVQRLTLQLNFKQQYNAKDLIVLFQNIRHFSILNTRDSELPSRLYTIIPRHPWRHRIESIVESFSEINTNSLLHSGVCKNLTYIAMSGAIPERGFITAFIGNLYNAPALKTLYLSNYLMVPRHIESIHKNAPLLSTFSLKNIIFSNSECSENIKPVTLIKRFHFVKITVFGNTFNKFLSYIRRKYTHVEDLALDLVQVDPFYVGRLTANDEYRQSITERREIMRAYVLTLAPHLKSFSIYLHNFDNENCIADLDFSELDASGCQIEKIKLGDKINPSMVESLAKTNQVQYIQSLAINEIYNNDYDINRLVGCLKSFIMLTELTLGYHRIKRSSKRQVLSITSLSKALKGSKVETLRLCDIELKFDCPVIISICPSLITLNCSHVLFQGGVDVMVSHLFPNLKRLILNTCFKYIMVYLLPRTRLSYLEITHDTNISPLEVLVRTNDNKLPRLYTSKTPVSAVHLIDDIEKNQFNYPSFSSQVFYRSSKIPSLEFSCKSVYNVSVRSCEPLPRAGVGSRSSDW